MEINEMFVAATRQKLRFPYKGMIGVEDLWDLPARQLDTVFKTLNADKKQSGEESLMSSGNTAEDSELAMKLAIVRYIFSVKMAEHEAYKKQRDNAQQKQKILALMAEKDDEEMRSKSKEELAAMLSQL